MATESRPTPLAVVTVLSVDALNRREALIQVRDHQSCDAAHNVNRALSFECLLIHRCEQLPPLYSFMLCVVVDVSAAHSSVQSLYSAHTSVQSAVNEMNLII